MSQFLHVKEQKTRRQRRWETEGEQFLRFAQVEGESKRVMFEVLEN